MTISFIFSPRPENEGTGLWGVPTSSVNWCEQDYTISYYVAEFFNTFSSLCMVFFGLLGQWSLRRLSPPSQTTSKDITAIYDPLLAHPSLLGIDRIWLTWFALQLVGWGSVAFHGSLQWWSQAFDEVPMVWTAIIHLTTCLVARGEPFPLAVPKTYLRQVTGLKAYLIPSLRRDAAGNWYTPVISAAFLLHAVTCSLLVTLFRGPSQFLIFHVLFGSVELAGFFLTFSMYRDSRKPGAETAFAYCRDECGAAEYKGLVQRHREDVRKLHNRGVWIYVTAIVIWSTDLNFCDYVSQIPVTYPDLAGFLAGGAGELHWVTTTVNPQGHAWWHLLVSIGFYHLGILATYERVLAGYREFWLGVARGEEGCMELLSEDKTRGRRVAGKGDVPVVEWIGGWVPVVSIRRRTSV
ncbi:hypothetical protein Dda_7790 [Drechslerella dactyloides]|uniref:Alkaline ceramidase 3 n=1 Tax=Drechslerella dactyloides TaxID=74499 RepID=A0AAD6IR75_DREDA|nr:hypothetical protein Dda_7790 [Drechslerella dactyloides]